MNLQGLSHENYFYWHFISSLANIVRNNKSFLICLFNIQGLSEIKRGLYLQFSQKYRNSDFFYHGVQKKNQLVSKAVYKSKSSQKVSFANSFNNQKSQLKKKRIFKFATFFQMNPNVQRLSKISTNFKFPLRKRNFSSFFKKFKRAKILKIKSTNFSKNGEKPQQLVINNFPCSTNSQKNILGKQWNKLIKLKLKKKLISEANSLTNKTNSRTFFSYQPTVYFLFIVNYTCTFCQKKKINPPLIPLKFVSENLNCFYIYQKSILKNYFLFFPCLEKSLNNTFSKNLNMKFFKKITPYMFFQNNYMNAETLLLIDTPSLNLNQTNSLFNKQLSCAIAFSNILNKFYSLPNFQLKYFLSSHFFSVTQKMNIKNRLVSLTLTKLKKFFTASLTNFNDLHNWILENKKKKTFSIFLEKIISNWFTFFTFLAKLKALFHWVSNFELFLTSVSIKSEGFKNANSTFRFNNVTTLKKFIMISKSSFNFEEFKRIISIFLKNQGLEISISETYTFSIEKKRYFQNLRTKKKKQIFLKPFSLLKQTTIKKSSKVLTNLFFYISHFSITLHFLKIKKLLKYERNLSLNILIVKLNREIRCWSYFYSQLKKCFSFHSNLGLSDKNRELKSLRKMNQYLNHLLWSWIKKRHNQQSNYWIFSRYWTFNIKKNYWIFSTQNAIFKRKYFLLNYDLVW